MVKVVPLGGEVDWPNDEGVLGVVGVAPWATIEFLNCFYSQVAATKDWNYPQILIDINTKIPSRGRHFDLGEPDPSPTIKATIQELRDSGATAVVVACNTAHLLFERWSKVDGIHVLNIFAAVAHDLDRKGSRVATVLSSFNLWKAAAYETYLSEVGTRYESLTEKDASRVAEVIESVKRTSTITEKDHQFLTELGKSLRNQGVDTVILGCTELSQCKEIFESMGLICVDSNEALAIEAITAIS